MRRVASRIVARAYATPTVGLVGPSPKLLSSCLDAVKGIQPGHHVFVHSASATPQPLLQAMVDASTPAFAADPVRLYHIHTVGVAPYLHPAVVDRFRSTAFFCGANDRDAVNDGRASFVPIFLSEISGLWKRGQIPLDYALLQVSPPDRHGWCSLGVSVDVSVSALQHAKKVIALVNPRMPRTHGEGFVHVSRIDAVVECDAPLPAHEPGAQGGSHAEQAVGRQVAQLIPDGATLQMGIGNIPDAVLAQLKDHRDLGIHTEMFSDGIMDLIASGACTGALKYSEPYQVTASFAVGSQRLYDFMDDNPLFRMMRTTYVNNGTVIANQPAMHAINSCVQVDLTGQICADSIGPNIFSGVGGQMDFMRASAISAGGKPIMAFTSRTARGVPRIVPLLNAGAGVVTTRSHAHWMVTEYGAVNLYGRDLQERAEMLISIAHPDDREELWKWVRARFPKYKAWKQ